MGGVAFSTRSRRVCASLGVFALSLTLSVSATNANHPEINGWGGTRTLSRADYADRLRAMWLGEAIANWTGIPVEGSRIVPPFFTDADWATPNGPPDFITNQNPWKADDDTDIEYVYLHALHALDPSVPPRLTGDQIREHWVTHINRFIWVSNAQARALMQRNVSPPSTALPGANFHRLAIDAQLTTELLGALAPGMPEVALDLADLPIRTTAHGHAAHASQVYVLLYSLATQVPADLSPRDKALWLTRSARRLIPDTSKAADIIDFVLADYLANPDRDNWESTRDKVYARYQSPGTPGFQYRGWTESSVNFASGIIALLYGECDYKRTVRIGILCGWDCDNAPATLGGLLGLMLGYDQLAAQFPGVSFSDRFWVARTRDNLPDYLPADPDADDTFTLMAERCLTVADRVIAHAGGLVALTGARQNRGQWLLPPVAGFNTDPLGKPNLAALFNPPVREQSRSNTWSLRTSGGSVTASSSAPASTPPGPYPWNYGTGNIAHIANGAETDARGHEGDDVARVFYSSQNPAAPITANTPLTFTVTYSAPRTVSAVRFIEGDSWPSSGPNSDANIPGGGGWVQSLEPELFLSGIWTPLPPGTTQSEPLNPDKPFQIIEWSLPAPVTASAVRLRGFPSGTSPTGPFVTISELDTLSPTPAPPPRLSYDTNADGTIDAEDLYLFALSPADLNGDETVTSTDWQQMLLAVRFRENRTVAPGR